MNKESTKPCNRVSLDSENGPCTPQEIVQLRDTLTRYSRQLLELSENLRQQQESFSAERRAYVSQIDALKERVKVLIYENRELENHLLNQNAELKAHFVLKRTLEEREAENLIKEELIKSLKSDLCKERSVNVQLRGSLHKWQELVTIRPLNREESQLRSNSGSSISHKRCQERRLRLKNTPGDKDTTNLREEVTSLLNYKVAQEERLRRTEDTLKNELRKVKLELVRALKSKDQLFKYCCLTSSEGSDEAFHEIEAILLRVSEVDPSYIDSYRKTLES